MRIGEGLKPLMTSQTPHLTEADGQHALMRLLASAGAPTRSQQWNTDQQMLFRNRWSSSTSSRIASGS